MRMALYVIIIFLIYLLDDLKIMSRFWIILVGGGGISCLLNDYLKKKK